MKAYIKLKNGSCGYLWNGCCEIGSFAIIETNDNKFEFGVITSIKHHFFTGRD